MKQHRILIWVINLAAFMVLMDLSAVNIALPSIKSYFNISVSDVSLILLASMLMASGSALIAGKLIETKPSKIVLRIAFAIFGTTSLLSSLSTEFYFLIPLRLIQGMAEAILYIIGPALIKKHINENQQQKEYGRWMMSCGLGISLGPIIGALFINYFGWQSVFLINVPLAVAGIYYSGQLSYEPAKNSHKTQADIKGAIFSFLFLGSFILFFNLFKYYSIFHPFLWLNLIFCFLFLALFIRQEKKHSHPIFDLQLFNINNFRQANLGFFLFFLINVGSRFLRPFYFEEARLLSTTLSGFLMMISPAIMLFISYYIDIFNHLLSVKKLVVLGNILLSISMLMFSLWDENSSLFFIISSMVILGMAMGIYYPATTQIGMKSLPHAKSGMGSASISISKSIGKLMGVVLFGLFFQLFIETVGSHQIEEISQKSTAISYVFGLGFLLSSLNSLWSLGIKN